MADANVVDISKRPERGSEWTRRLDIARLKHLSQMGLAYTNGHGKWHLAEDMEQRLTRLGERKDILKTYHRILKQAELSRAPRSDAIYDPFHSRAKPLIGKIIGMGIADDINDRAYVMVDSTRGHGLLCQSWARGKHRKPKARHGDHHHARRYSSQTIRPNHRNNSRQKRRRLQSLLAPNHRPKC